MHDAADPERLVERERDDRVDERATRRASRVGSHGRWRLKKLRVSSSVMPENGSENANQNSASLTWRVESASKSPRS